MLIRRGSIKVSIELSEDALEKLRLLYRDNNKELEAMQIQKIDFAPDKAEIFKYIGESVLSSINESVKRNYSPHIAKSGEEFSLSQESKLRSTDESVNKQEAYRYPIELDMRLVSEQKLHGWKREVEVGNVEIFLKEAQEIFPEASLNDLNILRHDLEQRNVDEITTRHSQRFQSQDQE